MDELLLNKRYHINYLLGTDFERRLYDAYIGYSTSKRPPFIEDIFQETAQMEALLVLESVKQNPWEIGMGHDDWDSVQELVWENDGTSSLDVLAGVSNNEVDMIIRDVMRVFYKYHLSSLIGKGTGHEGFINEPVKEVW